jgi:CDP-glucose 4,6-dehydratase
MEKLVKNGLFNGVYKNKNVLITGHTGFKGSWLALWLSHMGANLIGYALSPKGDSNHFKFLDFIINSIIADLADFNTLEKIINETNPEIIFHLAAQPYVIDSYHNPRETYMTNVMGTLNVLEAARKNLHVKAVVLITTDKVYLNKEKESGYIENDRLGGYDPYSSSKACCELLINSYRDSFFNTADYKTKHRKLITSARAGNVIGGGDWGNNRLIPDIVKNASIGSITSLRNPASVRPWQHVLESLSGYLLLGQNLLEEKTAFSGAWNFGPNYDKEISVKKVAEILSAYWDKVRFELNENGNSEYHETSLLKLDSTKAIKELKWLPIWDGETALKKTIDWYKMFYETGNIISLIQLNEYIEEALHKDLIWTR